MSAVLRSSSRTAPAPPISSFTSGSLPGRTLSLLEGSRRPVLVNCWMTTTARTTLSDGPLPLPVPNPRTGRLPP